VIALVWLLVAGLGAEYYLRWSQARHDAAGAALRSRMDAEAVQATARLCEDLGLPLPVTGSDIAARNVFATGDGVTRQRHAAERGEAVFVCRAMGEVEQAYLGSLPPVIAEAAAAIRDTGNVAAPLAGAESADAMAAFGMAMGGAMQLRDYPLHLPNGSEVAQFAFHPIPPGHVGVFVRPSQWKRLWLEFRPGVRQDDAYRLEINRHGFRDREVTLPKPPGVFRIVCVGGSTTAEGPTNDITYPRFLERLLRAQYPGRELEVINAGIFASTSYAERDRVEQYLALEPDLLLHYNAVNDLTNMAPGWLAQAPGASLAVAMGSSSALLRPVAEWALPRGDRLDGILRDTMIAALMELAAMARARGCNVAFASFTAPDYPHLPKEERWHFDREIRGMAWGSYVSFPQYIEIIERYNALLQEHCESEGHVYLPLAENFRHGAAFYTDICHMRPAGMYEKARVLARLLGPFLHERGFTPAAEAR
jgi:hypothetical protein